MNPLDHNPPAADAAPAAPPPATADHEPPPPGAPFMNALRWVLFAGLLLLAGLSIGGYVLSRHGAARPAARAHGVLYQCPMHPSYTSDRPGECPICGMALVPVSASDSAVAQDSAAGGVPGLSPVEMSPERIQMIGVRTVRATRRSLGNRLELVGFVAPDEARLKRIQLRVSGWVQQLQINRTGESVRAGEPVLSIYSPELYQSESEFLIELGGADSSSADGPSLRSARERLRLLGVPEEEISRLERERTATTRLALRSPVGGTVLERGVTEGQFVGAETPLLTVADLSRVWVLADLYEMDFTRARVGDRAEFTADAFPGRRFVGRVEFIYPTVASDTRTLKLRLALDNPDGALRPGMYGRVVVRGGGAETLAVPSEAVIHTGEHDYVFLARAGGRFEPRLIRVGLQDGDWVQVLHGLSAGDTLVASSSFLIDSESRLRAAIEGMGSQPGMAGMDHDRGGAP